MEKEKVSNSTGLEQEIQEQAEKLYPRSAHAQGGFIAGAQWMQEREKHQAKTLLIKINSQLEAYKSRMENETWKDAQPYYKGGIDATTNAIRLFENNYHLILVNTKTAKDFMWEWLNKKDMVDVVLDNDDIQLLMADFANSLPSPPKA